MRQPLEHRSVGILPLDGFPLLSFACVVDPFRFANTLSGTSLYDVSVIGNGSPSVGSSGPAFAKIDHNMDSEMVFDYLFVIAGGRPETFSDPKTLNWITRLARKGSTIAGVSGGPVILAKSGIATGRRMTVHWEHAPYLLETYADLLLERTLFTKDRSLITCGGGAAALDMTLDLIKHDHGADFVRRVSDWCLHTDIREASNAQRKAAPKNVGPANAIVHKVVQAMEENISTPLTVPELSKIAGISGRQLGRIFIRSTGETVIEYYRNLRLDFAMNLLRSSALSITRIALATGFSSSSHFTTTFCARYGYLPSSLRV